MLRADGRVIEAGGDGMRERDLTGIVLKNVGKRSLQNTRPAAFKSKARGVLAKLGAAAAGFHADELHLLFRDEFVEHSDRVRTATNARNDGCGQFAFGF